MKNSIVFLVTISIFACGCETYHRPESEAIKVELRGTPGLRFSGSYWIDGKEQFVYGTVPMNIETSGGLFYSEFRKESEGALTAIVTKNCKPYGEATSITEGGGVESKISTGELFDLTSTTGF